MYARPCLQTTLTYNSYLQVFWRLGGKPTVEKQWVIQEGRWAACVECQARPGWEAVPHPLHSVRNAAVSIIFKWRNEVRDSIKRSPENWLCFSENPWCVKYCINTTPTQQHYLGRSKKILARLWGISAVQAAQGHPFEAMLTVVLVPWDARSSVLPSPREVILCLWYVFHRLSLAL